MARILRMHDLAVGDLLEGAWRYAIPPFQREYAWERHHARRLLDDIVTAGTDPAPLGEPLPYFLGTMLVCDASTDNGDLQHLVIDGQQRLVTLITIIACLRDLARTEAEAARMQRWIMAQGAPRLMLRPDDQAFFDATVQRPGATKRPVRLTRDASATFYNLAENRALLRRNLAQLNDADRAATTQFMTNGCRVALIQTDNFDYAHQIFLAINQRGKELSVEDMFQAELLGPLSAPQQDRYKAIIGQVGKYRRERRTSVSRNKTFFSHIAAANLWSGRAIVSSIRSAIRASGSPKAFSEKTFVPAAEAYLALSGKVAPPPGLTPEARTALEHLQMLEAHGDDDWVSTAILVWTRHAPDDPALGRLLKALDRKAHSLMPLGYGGAPRRKLYGEINQAIHSGAPWTQIEALLQIPASAERLLVSNIARKLHELDKATCRLFLLRIDAHISKRPLAEYQAMPGYALGGENAFTVEHLLPKGSLNRAVEADWARGFPSAKQREASAQYLGNLTLVTCDENAELGQAPFREKKRILARSGRHPIHMTEELQKLTDFDAGALAKRHDRMMRAVAEIWSLPAKFPSAPGAGSR